MTEHERLVALAYKIHEEARANTKSRAYSLGSVQRGIANRILHELGEPVLPYEGPPPSENARRWAASWNEVRS
jgi:hypothetical protein